jgi:dihydrofolate reductase
MGALIVTEFVTLDGVAQAPGRPDEDRDDGFEHGGWQAPFAAEETGRDVYDNAKSMDALLLGRKTYDIFASYWPTAPADSPFTALLNGVPKFVASRTLRGPLGWEDSTLLDAGSLDQEIASVKQRHEEVHVIGSLDLVQSLLRLGLVDRLVLWMYPVLLGSGKRVFATGTVPRTLTLATSTPYANGMLKLDYELGGPPNYGTMGSE